MLSKLQVYIEVQSIQYSQVASMAAQKRVVTSIGPVLWAYEYEKTEEG